MNCPIGKELQGGPQALIPRVRLRTGEKVCDSSFFFPFCLFSYHAVGSFRSLRGASSFPSSSLCLLLLHLLQDAMMRRRMTMPEMAAAMANASRRSPEKEAESDRQGYLFENKQHPQLKGTLTVLFQYVSPVSRYKYKSTSKATRASLETTRSVSPQLWSKVKEVRPLLFVCAVEELPRGASSFLAASDHLTFSLVRWSQLLCRIRAWFPQTPAKTLCFSC